MTQKNAIAFTKMHGLGNDFVVLDARATSVADLAALAAVISNRRTGIGCDQLITLESPKSPEADVFMRIHNADGSEAGACGNATRCVASRLMAETGNSHVVVETISGLLDCEAAEGGLYSVDMGPAQLDWRDIPLAEACDTEHLPISVGALSDPVGVGMGNPHAVFFVDDAEAVDLATLGPEIEHHKLFPQFTNVEVVEVLDDKRLRVRVWERGAGLTLACGSGACAALVAASRRGLIGRKADVVMDGGTLTIEWMADNNVLMTGPVATAFSGTIDPSLSGAGA